MNTEEYHKEGVSLEMMVLDKKDDWKEHCHKLNEEVIETFMAIAVGNKEHMVSEVLDTIQVCVGMMHKLYGDGVDLEKAIAIHNSKLVDRGWDHKAIIRIQVIKR